MLNYELFSLRNLERIYVDADGRCSHERGEHAGVEGVDEEAAQAVHLTRMGKWKINTYFLESRVDKPGARI